MSELDIKSFVFRKGASKRIPVSGTFELTSRCNFNCKMCYVYMSPKDQEHIGQELTAQEWIRLGEEAVAEGMIYLLLTGGEPLLRPDFLEIYTALIKMGLMITVNTNASLITPEILDCFKKYRPEKVNVTLYGMSDCTYHDLCGNSRGFEASVRNILAMKEAGIRVNLSTTFTKLNLADMDRIVGFAKEHEIPVRMASFVFPPVRNQRMPEDVYLSPEEMGRAAAHFDQLTMDAGQMERRREAIEKCISGQPATDSTLESRISSCLAGRGAFWISWDGKMFPCGMLPGYEANVCDTDFRTAWKKTCSWVQEMYLPSECLGCRYQKICPSCAAVSMSIHGSTNILSKELCARTEAYVQAMLHSGQDEAGK